MFSERDSQTAATKSRSTKLTATSYLKSHAKAARDAEMLKAAEETAKRLPDKPWYDLTVDELVQEYHQKQLELTATEVNTAKSTCADSWDPLNSKLGTYKHAVGFGTSSAPRLSREEVANYKELRERVGPSPGSPMHVKLRRVREKELEEEIAAVASVIQRLLETRVQNRSVVEDLVAKLQASENELLEVRESGLEAYQRAVVALETIKKNKDQQDQQQPEGRRSSDETVTQQAKKDIKPSASGRRTSVVGRRSSMKGVAGFGWTEEQPITVNIDLQALPNPAAIASIREESLSVAIVRPEAQQVQKFQASRDQLFTKKGLRRASVVMDQFDRHEKIRAKIRLALLAFSNKHKWDKVKAAIQALRVSRGMSVQIDPSASNGSSVVGSSSPLMKDTTGVSSVSRAQAELSMRFKEAAVRTPVSARRSSIVAIQNKNKSPLSAVLSGPLSSPASPDTPSPPPPPPRPGGGRRGSVNTSSGQVAAFASALAQRRSSGEEERRTTKSAVSVEYGSGVGGGGDGQGPGSAVQAIKDRYSAAVSSSPALSPKVTSREPIESIRSSLDAQNLSSVKDKLSMSLQQDRPSEVRKFKPFSSSGSINLHDSIVVLD